MKEGFQVSNGSTIHQLPATYRGKAMCRCFDGYFGYHEPGCNLYSPDDPHCTQARDEVEAELAEVMQGCARANERIEQWRHEHENLQRQVVEAQQQLHEAQSARIRLLGSLSPEARELLSDAGAVEVDGDLWVWLHTTDEGIPVMRKLRPLRIRS